MTKEEDVAGFRSRVFLRARRTLTCRERERETEQLRAGGASLLTACDFDDDDDDDDGATKHESVSSMKLNLSLKV